MEGSAFDRFTRAFGIADSRRRVLSLVVGVPAAGLLGQLDAEDGQAKRKRHGRRNRHRPGKRKDNRKGKRKGDGVVGCTEIYASCTDDSQCCSYPQSTCKTVAYRGFCCGVSNVDPCQSDCDCCSGRCDTAELICE
jgi:hypothetical protein